MLETVSKSGNSDARGYWIPGPIAMLGLPRGTSEGCWWVTVELDAPMPVTLSVGQEVWGERKFSRPFVDDAVRLDKAFQVSFVYLAPPVPAGKKLAIETQATVLSAEILFKGLLRFDSKPLGAEDSTEPLSWGRKDQGFPETEFTRARKLANSINDPDGLALRKVLHGCIYRANGLWDAS